MAAICKVARDRGWRAYRAVEAFVSASGACRRRALLDHFGDARPGAPEGRCCDVCDPGHDRPARPGVADAREHARKAKAVAPAGPVDAPLLDALKEWRLRASDGKPAYTVAHNSTLESIAALKPSHARRAGGRSRESARRSSSGTASRCWRWWRRLRDVMAVRARGVPGRRGRFREERYEQG